MIEYIRTGINEETGLYIVDTDSNSKKPNYPFYSFKITSFLLDNNQAGAVESVSGDRDIEETMTLDSKLIISLNAYSNNIEQARKKALQLWEWFKFRGKPYLSLGNIVVVNTGNIQDRTIHIVDSYEYRFGFDVEVRQIQKIDRTIETIETYKIEGEIKR